MIEVMVEKNSAKIRGNKRGHVEWIHTLGIFYRQDKGHCTWDK